MSWSFGFWCDENREAQTLDLKPELKFSSGLNQIIGVKIKQSFSQSTLGHCAFLFRAIFLFRFF